MYVKKLKRKCGVKGCKHTETFTISKNREMGNSVIVCKECLIEALNTIEEQDKPIEFEKAEPVKVAEHEETPVVDEMVDNAEINESVAEEKPTRQRKAK